MIVNHFADTFTQLKQFRLIHGGRMTTFEDLAVLLDVRLCPGGPDCLRQMINHQHGGSSASLNTVHWAPRRLTKRGIRRFLLVTARMRVMNYWSRSPAMRIFLSNAWATKRARDLHIRFPSQWSRTDRLTVLWLASKGDQLTPEARRWASRKEPINGR